jgi:hypothetical protein
MPIRANTEPRSPCSQERDNLQQMGQRGQVEGQINRLKALKRAMYGRASVELQRARMLPFEFDREHGN